MRPRERNKLQPLSRWQTKNKTRLIIDDETFLCRSCVALDFLSLWLPWVYLRLVFYAALAQGEIIRWDVAIECALICNQPNYVCRFDFSDVTRTKIKKSKKLENEKKKCYEQSRENLITFSSGTMKREGLMFCALLVPYFPIHVPHWNGRSSEGGTWPLFFVNASACMRALLLV